MSPASLVSSPAPRTDDTPAWQPLAGVRVLLADDARGARHLYRTALARAGAEVVTADDGTAAVEAWRAAEHDDRPFAAAVLDYLMPGLDGSAVTTAMRAGGFRGAVIGLSAELSDADAAAWRSAGCDEFLPKGVSLDGLVARVAAGVRRAGPR